MEARNLGDAGQALLKEIGGTVISHGSRKAQITVRLIRCVSQTTRLSMSAIPIHLTKLEIDETAKRMHLPLHILLLFFLETVTCWEGIGDRIHTVSGSSRSWAGGLRLSTNGVRNSKLPRPSSGNDQFTPARDLLSFSDLISSLINFFRRIFGLLIGPDTAAQNGGLDENGCFAGSSDRVKAEFCPTNNCCQGTGACSWGDSLNTICPGSCSGDGACVWSDGVEGNTIGEDACQGPGACSTWSGNDNFIGAGSCAFETVSNTNAGFACSDWKLGGHRVESMSCNGADACSLWSGSGNSVDGGSCNTQSLTVGGQACSLWELGGHSIGAGTCGFGNDACAGWTGANYLIGDSSCKGGNVCQNFNAVEVSIGNGACGQGLNTTCSSIGSLIDKVDIKDGACNGVGACFELAFEALGATLEVLEGGCHGVNACSQAFKAFSLTNPGDKATFRFEAGACQGLNRCVGTLEDASVDATGNDIIIEATCDGSCFACADDGCSLSGGDGVFLVNPTTCSGAPSSSCAQIQSSFVA